MRSAQPVRVPAGSGKDAARLIVALQGHENRGLLRCGLAACCAG